MDLKFESIGTGPPVVLVNGASPLAWGELPERLASNHRVITYARRGFPPNDGLPLARSLREHTDDLADLLLVCGGATVIGWSSGGVVALDLALRRPDLIARLVVIEPPLHARRRPTFGVMRAVVGAQIRGRRNPMRGARHFLAWALGRSDGRPSDVARFNEAAIRRAAPAILNELPHATGESEIRLRDLPRLEVDTTWLVGAVSAAGNRRLAVRAANRSRRITIKDVAGSGHPMALDAPEVIVDAATTSPHVEAKD